MKIRAAVIDKPGANPEVQEIELAGLAHDEVLVRLKATGVCHTDLYWRDGKLFPDEFPVVVGHESAGVVEDAGSSVTRVKKGDAVVLALAFHCGHCRMCESGRPMLCPERTNTRPHYFRSGKPLIQGFGTGGFADATIVKESSPIKIPEGVPLEVAAVCGCAVATGLGAAWNLAEIRPGSTVAVFGCGGIGLSIIMGARIAGAERIVAVDPNRLRQGTALRLGATDAIGPQEGDLLALQPEGYDYVFEAVGQTDVMEMAVRVTGIGGTVVIIGATGPQEKFSIQSLDWVVKQRKMLGCLTGSVRPNIDFDCYFRLYRRGLLDLDSLVTSKLPLNDVAKAFARSESADGIRTIVTMD
ncbi:MAG: alcohol dehydrogenase catalytic domain-containing protein [Acidobacteria bacterium]|nr:alcohol dehydrogenase catalytic domain-containing protein [Acidobacteriota bacterium]MCI0718758.1 alcohol dehydrogenase catalytic domain-containing protein [Acidobacteriota bacterium]